MDKKTKPEETDAVEAEVEETEELSAEMFEVPEDLTTLDDDALASLAAEVTRRGQELAARASDLSDEELEEAEELAVVAAEFETESARRVEFAAERTERASSALARFATATVDEEVTDEAAAEVEAEVEAVEETEADAVSETPENIDASDGKEPEVVTASARPTSFRGASPAFLKNKSKAPAVRSQERQEFMVSTALATGMAEGSPLDSPAAVASALYKKRMSFGNIPAGTQEMISIATGTKTFTDDAPVVGLDPQANLTALREVQHALVASGECCTPQTQLYDFFRLAQPIRDVEDAITTVQAPRGGIRYIAANCTVAGAGAVGFYDCDDSAQVDPLVEKPCDRVSCPEIEETLVEAITQCTIFDNLQYRTFPELIENFQEDVAVQFTLKKQRYYLDKIDAASTHVNGIGSYGAARSLMYDLTVAAVGYRKRHHMPRGATLQVFMPDWSIDLVKADLFNDGDSGLDYMNVPDSAVIEALAVRNLDVTFYYDDPTSTEALNTLADPQAVGPLNDFPLEVTSFMFAPGTFVRLDGGTLDLGLVRDHTLNKTNDFAMFMEEWIGFAMLGCESIRIDSVVCPSGSRAPSASALRSCGNS